MMGWCWNCKFISIILKKDIKTVSVSHWTKNLAAVKKPTPDFNHKDDYRDYLLKKLSKD